METITISQNLSYTDTRDNLLFWAKEKGYREMVNENKNMPIPHGFGTQIPNPQPLEEFCKEFMAKEIQRIMTEPIQLEVKRQMLLQAEQIGAQKKAEVLSRLIIE